MRVDPTYVRNLVSALDQTQATQQQLSAELASGVRVNSISQDPLAAGENVRLLNQIQQDDSFTQSSGLVTGQLQVADSALGQVVSQLTRAVQLATSANNGTLNGSDRQAIANELEGIRGEVLTLANSNYQGQFIFAGGQTNTSPFALSNATTPATVSYTGDTDVNYMVTPNNQKIQLNVPGSQIFQAGGTNDVFASLNSLIADYSGSTMNTGQAVNDTTALSSALNYVSQQRVTIDNSITQLQAATTAVKSQQTQLTVAQTNLMQADVATVSTQLSMASTQQVALEDIIAQTGNNNLFQKIQP